MVQQIGLSVLPLHLHQLPKSFVWSAAACHVPAQTKRRYKLRQIQDSGKTASHPDMGSVVSSKSSGAGEKEPLLPVTIVATSATGMQGQHRKGALVSPTNPMQQHSNNSNDRGSDKDTV